MGDIRDLVLLQNHVFLMLRVKKCPVALPLTKSYRFLNQIIHNSPAHTLYNNISQEVCEHFEGILKMMNLLKQLVLSRVPAGVGSHQLRSSGVLALLPPAPGTAASEGLGSAIHSSCVELIQHIVSQAQPFLAGLSPHSKEKKSKEVYTDE